MATTLNRWPWLRESCAATLGFLALSLAFCYPAGLSNGILATDDDGIRSYFPYLLRALWPVDASVAGAWDPTVFTGLPESHTPFGRYYPPTIVLHGLFGPTRALALGVVLHHAWAGLGAYLLLRLGGRSWAASWLAGICFAFGGFVVFHRGHPPMQQAAAWLPWVLAAFELFRTRGTWIWVAVAGTFLTLLGLPGHPQMTVLGGVVWLTYLVYFTWVGPGSRCPRRRFLLGVATALLVGALGSLPQNLPTAEVGRWSPYREVHGNFVGDGHLKLRWLAGMFGPWVLGGGFGAGSPGDYLGVSEQGLFYGLLPLATAATGLAGLWIARRQRQRIQIAEGATALPAREAAHDGNVPARDPTVGFWLILLVENLLLMSSKSLALHYVLAHVPVYNLFHIPARHVWVVGLALAWLAAQGLDQLRRAAAPLQKRLLRSTGQTLLALAAGAVVCVLFLPAWPDRPGWSYPGFWIPVASGIAAVGTLAMVCRLLPGRPRAVVLVPLIAFVELWLSIGRHDLTTARADVLTSPAHFPEVVTWLRGRASGAGPTRCVMQEAIWHHDDNAWYVPSTFASAWGLSALSAYSQSMPASLTALMHLNVFGHADLSAVLTEERGLSALGGRYIVATYPLSTIAPGLGHWIATQQALTWHIDQQTPGRHTQLVVPRQEGWGKALVAKVPGAMGPTYHVEGALCCGEPREGSVRIVSTNRNSCVVLAERPFSRADFQAGRLSFHCTYDLGTTPGTFWLAVACKDDAPVELAHVAVWQLTPWFGRQALNLDPREVTRSLHAGTQQPYPEVACFASGIRVYENPRARALATLVREVRPAVSVADAARQIVVPGPPVRDAAYVVAPDEQPAAPAITGPVHLAPGTAEVCSYRPDAIQVRTRTAGPGFLVLAVTRCIGWSALVDDQPVPIRAVDGPLMGVSVPAGEHTVRFAFRPVLAWAGAAAAALGLGGVWLSVVAGAVVRGVQRRRRAVPPLGRAAPANTGTAVRAA